MTSAMRLQTETVSRWSRWWLMSKLMGWQATGHPNHEEIAAGDSGETCGHPKPPSCRWGDLSRFFFFCGGVFAGIFVLNGCTSWCLEAWDSYQCCYTTQKVSALEMLENPERQCKEDFLLYIYIYLKSFCGNISSFSGHFLFGWKENWFGVQLTNFREDWNVRLAALGTLSRWTVHV